MDESLEWHALNIVKHHNVFYRHNIVTQGFPRRSLKQHLQFEVHYVKLCFLYNIKIWDFDFKVALKLHVFFTFSHGDGHSNPPLNPIFGFAVQQFWTFWMTWCAWVYTYSCNPNIWFVARMISSFLIPWIYVVILNMALKPYPELCNCRKVVIQLQFAR